MKEEDRTQEQPANELAATRQRVAELETILEMSRQLASDLTLEPLLEKALAVATALTGGEAASVLLRDGRTGAWRCHTAFSGTSKLVETDLPVPVEGSIAGTILTSQEPLILPDAQVDPRYRREVDGPIGFETRALLGVPLIARGRVIGLLAVHSPQPACFTSDHARLATALAGQVAVALENARLYRSREAVLRQAETRAQLLDTLEQTARAVSSGLNLETTLDTIYEQVRRVMQIDAFFVALHDEDTGLITYPLVYDRGRRYEEPSFPLPPGSKLSQVFDSGEPVLINRTAEEMGAKVPAPESAIGDRERLSASLLYVPLYVGSRLVGAISTQSYRLNAYGQRDVTLLTGIASHAAIAIENARLYDEAQQRVAELETLQRTSLKLSSSLDLSAVLDSIAESAMTLVGATDCLIYLYDETSESFSFGTALGRWATEGMVFAPREGGLTATVVREGRPVVINDAVGHPLYAAPEAQAWNIQSIAGLPLQRAGRVLGVLDVAFVERHLFREEELRVLGLLADQAAIAIENARLFEAERAQLEELIVLHAVATAGAEVVSEDVLIERVTRIIGETLYPADDFGVMLLDETTGVLHVHPSYYQASEDARRIVVPAGQGVTGTVAVSGRPWRIADVTRVAEYIDDGVGTRSELCVPLRVGERIIGVINVESQQPDAFSAADERLLATVAGQLATAIEKVRLYEEAQQEIAERVRVEEELRRHRDQLEKLVKARTAALTQTNVQLQEEIGERKRAEATLRKYQEGLEELVEERTADLRESEERYRTLFDGVPVGLYRSTPAGQMVDANLAMVQMLGYPSREDLLAINSASLYMDPEERVQWQALMEREGVVRDFEIRNRRYDGTIIWVNETARAVRDKQGQVLYYEGSLEDITERKQTRQKLKESEEEFRTLYEATRDAVMLLDDKSFFDCNPATLKIFGCETKKQFVGKHPSEFSPEHQPDNQDSAILSARRIETALREGSCFFEWQHKRLDGTEFPAEVLLSAMEIRGRKVLQAVVRDITERKRAEAELRTYREHLEELVEERTAELWDSEERYRTLFDGVPIGLYRTTPAGKAVQVNLATAQMLGYPDQEEVLLEIDIMDLYVNPRDRVRWQALIEREGVVRDFETRLYRQDGTIIWVGDNARAVRDEQGQVLYYEGSLEDITERKEFEEEIRHQKEYFEALFVNSPVAVVTADTDANVVAWNPMAEKLFGYTQEEAIGQNLDDLVADDPRVREEALRYTRQALTTGRVQATAKRTRKDGTWVDVEVLAVDVVAGEMVGFIAIYYDIGELQEARRAAEAANQAKSVFLANMSHELRTPLNAILGFTQLMDRDPNLTAEQQENLGIINRSGEHLLALINDVLEMSKIEAGRVTLEEKSFDLYRLLDGLEEMFRLRAEEKGLTLTCFRAGNVPQYVRMDEGKLRQVLGNLLGNAVKFTQEGGVALRVGMKEEGRRTIEQPSSAVRRSSLVFEVEDTGPGIAPEEQAAVFDPFVQATSGQQSPEGTGLGLSICRQHVRLMGGDIAVSSQLGQGSLFRFDVQVGLADATKVQTARPRRQVIGVEAGQMGYRLLVVEDKETNRRLLVRLLESLGFEVKEALNGQEALEVWERWEPHLIWMDMRMPVMDGYEATRRIKATARGQATVIVALTATAFEEDRERILLEGCDDFVRKPFRKDQIYDVLAKHLGVRFVYEEEPVPSVAAEPADVLTPAALATLPAGWLADLHEATVKADLNLMLALIDQIREQAPVLAGALADLARDFGYKRILAFIQQAGGER